MSRKGQRQVANGSEHGNTLPRVIVSADHGPGSERQTVLGGDGGGGGGGSHSKGAITCSAMAANSSVERNSTEANAQASIESSRGTISSSCVLSALSRCCSTAENNRASRCPIFE